MRRGPPNVDLYRNINDINTNSLALIFADECKYLILRQRVNAVKTSAYRQGRYICFNFLSQQAIQSRDTRKHVQTKEERESDRMSRRNEIEVISTSVE